MSEQIESLLHELILEVRALRADIRAPRPRGRPPGSSPAAPRARPEPNVHLERAFAERGLTVARVASDLELQPASVWHWLNGENGISRRAAGQLQERYGIPLTVTRPRDRFSRHLIQSEQRQ